MLWNSELFIWESIGWCGVEMKTSSCHPDKQGGGGGGGGGVK